MSKCVLQSNFRPKNDSIQLFQYKIYGGNVIELFLIFFILVRYMSPKSLHFSHVQLSATLWTVVCQASLSMDSLGKDTGVVAMTSPGDLPHPGFKPKSPASVGRFFTTIYNKVLFSRFLNVRFSGIHIVVRPPPPSISGTFLLSQTETVSIKPLLPSPTL